MQILAGAEPIFYRGNSIGCLCLHGFMASPNEVSWLGHFLAQQGYTVYCPRLAGHGITPQHIPHLRWEDYFGSALDGYHILRQQCEQIFVCGMSMGGTLGLLLSTQVQIDGLALLATPVHFPSRLRHTRWIHYLRRYNYYPTASTITEKVKTEQQRRGESAVGRVRYEYWSLAAINQLYQLAQVTYQKLPQVTAPLLLIYTEKDDVVPLYNCDLIAEQVSSKIIQKHILKESGHILTQDSERDTVFELVGNFIQQF